MPDPFLADALQPRYRRVVLKLSGEGFGHSGKSGISIDETLNVARQAQRILQRGVQLAIVVGGGNILRGAQFSAGGEVIREATAHYMGMLATILNGLALQDALETLRCETRLQTATRVDGVYSDDPEVNPHAVRYEKLTYPQVLRDNLRVMDMEAISLCRAGKMPIMVFNYEREGAIERAIAGHLLG